MSRACGEGNGRPRPHVPSRPSRCRRVAENGALGRAREAGPISLPNRETKCLIHPCGRIPVFGGVRSFAQA